ncbi:hypothetical protein CVT24_000244, partial [Panaeolus cyanescens]
MLCASCSRQFPLADVQSHPVKDLNLNSFASPRYRIHADSDDVVDPSYPDTILFAPQYHPIREAPFVMLDPKGIVDGADEQVLVRLCVECHKCSQNGRVPPLSLANHNFIGDIPEQLQGLFYVEESMISLCRSKTTVVQLTEFESKQSTITAQKALKGNVIVFPQSPSNVARCLPMPPADIAKQVCVVFIGSSNPSEEWLLSKAKPLVVRADKVRVALQWLKDHNPLYRHIQIDYQLFQTLPAESVIPVDVHRYDNIVSFVNLTSTYDASSNVRTEPELFEENVEFEKICIPEGVDISTPAKMRAEAGVHLK